MDINKDFEILAKKLDNCELLTDDEFNVLNEDMMLLQDVFIGAAKKADIMDLPIVEVLEELAKEEYCSDWDILINDIANGE